MIYEEEIEVEYLKYKKLVRNLRLRKNEKSTSGRHYCGRRSGPCGAHLNGAR